jgi:hypothetical protein
MKIISTNFYSKHAWRHGAVEESSSLTSVFGNSVTEECFTLKMFMCMKNGVFWDVTPGGSCKNRRFGGT